MISTDLSSFDCSDAGVQSGTLSSEWPSGRIPVAAIRSQVSQKTPIRYVLGQLSERQARAESLLHLQGE